MPAFASLRACSTAMRSCRTRNLLCCAVLCCAGPTLLPIAVSLIRLVIAGIIAFAFGDTILPEVQATVGGNAKKEMYKGISMGYSILLSSYMVVAIAGYWAFGYNVRPAIQRLLIC